MRHRHTLALAALLAAACIRLHASPAGELHRNASSPTAAVRDAAHRPGLRITVWYPAADDAAETPLEVGPPRQPLFHAGRAAAGAPFAAGAHPVVMLSHGFGGSARVMAWFGTALAREGYVVVAVDHPGNNGVDPMTLAGATAIWERAEDLRAALAAVRADPVIGPHLDLRRLGVAGFSLGGFTALLAAGARADIGHLEAFCDAHAEDPTCLPQQEAPGMSDEARKRALATPPLAALLPHAGDSHALPGVRAAFLMAPAPVQGVAPASLRALKIPVTILLGDADGVAPPVTNGTAAAGLLPHARLRTLHGVGHYDFLADCTAAGRQALPRLCTTAVPKDDTHAAAIALATELFGRSL